MKELKLKPKFEELVNNPALTREEKLNAILKDTVSHYNKDNRCASIQCAYHPSTLGFTMEKTEGCAIGRLLEPESALAIDQEFPPEGSEGSNIINVITKITKDITFPQFIINNKEFFADLQDLHDSKSNWDSEGLTPFGKINLDNLKSLFNLKYVK